MPFRLACAPFLWLALIGLGGHGLGAADRRHGGEDVWVDALTGESTSFDNVVADLSKVDIIYLGERHTIERHHALQAKVAAALAERKLPFAIALEQMEAEQQPLADRFNRGEFDFARLAKESHWAARWSNYAQYAPILKIARQNQAPVIALNARAETVRQVVRSGGVQRLPSELRKQLPAQVQLDDPAYAKLLSMQMMVHMAAQPELVRPMVEAQIARDETMAHSLAAFWKSQTGPPRKIVVLCGSGHIAFGMGLPARVQSRLPQTRARTIVFSENGELELSPAERDQARDITITHEQLREFGRPLADYLVVKSRTAP